MSRRKIRKGSPQRNVPNEGGVGFFGDFRQICRHVSKTVHLRHKRTVIGNYRQGIDRKASYNPPPYIYRANVLQVSRGFVSGSLPFVYISALEILLLTYLLTYFLRHF